MHSQAFRLNPAHLTLGLFLVLGVSCGGPPPPPPGSRCAEGEPSQALSSSTCDWPTAPSGGALEPGIYEAAVIFKGTSYADAGECSLGPNEPRPKLRLVLTRNPNVSGSGLQAFRFEAVRTDQARSTQRGQVTVDTNAHTLRFVSECVDGAEVVGGNRDLLFIASPRSLTLDSSRASVPAGRAPNEGSVYMIRFDRVD